MKLKLIKFGKSSKGVIIPKKLLQKNDKFIEIFFKEFDYDYLADLIVEKIKLKEV